MVFLIRFILVTLIIYLLIRSFIRYFAEEKTSPNDRENHAREEKKPKGISKEIGEYVDYEEVDD